MLFILALAAVAGLLLPLVLLAVLTALGECQMIRAIRHEQPWLSDDEIRAELDRGP